MAARALPQHREQADSSFWLHCRVMEFRCRRQSSLCGSKNLNPIPGRMFHTLIWALQCRMLKKSFLPLLTWSAQRSCNGVSWHGLCQQPPGWLLPSTPNSSVLRKNRTRNGHMVSVVYLILCAHPTHLLLFWKKNKSQLILWLTRV